MANWDEAAAWYLARVNDVERGFNHLATDIAIDLLGSCAGRTVLDVGCGEGGLARRLAEVGAKVWATEPTRALLAAAVESERQRPLGIRYAADPAEDLRSIESGQVDALLGLLVLHHVEHLRLAWAEAHRVLRAGGSLIVVIPHPWTDHEGATWCSAHDGPLRRQVGAYQREGHWNTDDTDSIRRIGWHHRTLATWLSTCAEAGFIIDTVREPTGADPRRSDSGGHWSEIPRFLAWRATRDE